MARKIPVADDAIARVALTTLLDTIAEDEQVYGNPHEMATKVIEAASRVQFQPSTRRLVLTFDLGMSPDEDAD